MKRRMWSQWPHSGGDRGSLVMVMLVVIVGMGLAALMLPLVMTQTGTTTFDAGRGRALQAAESGIDIAIGYIREAGENDPTGASGLPCGDIPTADLGTSARDGKYALHIEYYGEDPSQTAATAMTCPPTKPRYAKIISTGTDGATAKSRTLVTTYILGIPAFTGFIQLYYDSTLCLTSTGDPNDTPRLAKCGTDLPNQQFQATADGRIVLAGRTWCIRVDGGSGNVVVGQCTESWISLPTQFEDVEYVQLSMAQPNNKLWCVNADSPAASSEIGAAECSDLDRANDPNTLQAWKIDFSPTDNAGPPPEAPGPRDLHEK